MTGRRDQVELTAAAEVGQDDPGRVHTFLPDAAAVFSSGGEACSVNIPGRPPMPDTRDSRVHATAMCIRARHDSVHIERAHRRPVVVDGLPGRLLSEVVLLRGPVAWEIVAREIWPRELDPFRLRRGWDRALYRLRLRLREAGLSEDLVRHDGKGRVELVLGPGDVAVDEA